MATYLDAVNVEGQMAATSLAMNFALTTTAATTVSLTAASATVQGATGGTVGLIYKLPDATTLVSGRKFEFFNLATTPITIQNNAGTTLAVISAGQDGTFYCGSTANAAGAWGIDNDTPGADFNFAVSASVATSNSTTYTNKVSIGPITLGAGTYELDWSYLFYSTPSPYPIYTSRFVGQVTQNGTQIWSHVQGATDLLTDARQPAGGVIAVTLAAGTYTWALQYAAPNPVVTVGISNAVMKIKRIL